MIAFETEIAEPDKDGGALRYRGIDIEELVGRYPFENVWGLLVDEDINSPLPAVGADRAAGPERLGAGRPAGRARDARAEVGDEEARRHRRQAGARRSRAASRRATLTIVAQAARGKQTPVPEAEVAKGENAAAQFLIRWRGEADPKQVKALDTYWISAAEHGLNASTFTARIAASTGADCAAAMSSAVGTLSGPLHGGAPARVLPMIEGAEGADDLEQYVNDMLDRGERIMGFGHRVYRAYDPRATVLKRTAMELGSPRVEVAAALEEAALKVLRERRPTASSRRTSSTGPRSCSTTREIPPDLTPAMFGCARVAGWSAHILEQKRTGRLIRPSARYIGPAPRTLADL